MNAKPIRTEADYETALEAYERKVHPVVSGRLCTTNVRSV